LVYPPDGDVVGAADDTAAAAANVAVDILLDDLNVVDFICLQEAYKYLCIPFYFQYSISIGCC
jgi:hypothetical protein